MLVTEKAYPKGLSKALAKAGPILNVLKEEEIAHYGFAGVGGTYIHLHCGYCHAGLKLFDYDGHWEANDGMVKLTKIPKYVVNGILASRLPDEMNSPFLEWLLNYSPYSSVFLTKSPKTAMRDGYYVAYTDTPSNLLAGALIAGRSMNEYTDIVVVWNELVKRGVHPNIAFAWAHLLGTEPFSLHTRCSHVAMDGRLIGDRYVLNFLQNVRVDEPSYRETGTYRNIHNTWLVYRDDIVPNVTGRAPALMDELTKLNAPKNNPFDLRGKAKSVEPGVGFDAFSSLLKEGYKAYV